MTSVMLTWRKFKGVGVGSFSVTSCLGIGFWGVGGKLVWWGSGIDWRSGLGFFFFVDFWDCVGVCDL